MLVFRSVWWYAYKSNMIVSHVIVYRAVEDSFPN